MIRDADVGIREWLAPAVDGADVSFEAPTVAAEGRGVSVHLLDLLDAPPHRGPDRPPVQVALRYLLTAWAPTAEERHDLLGAAIVAAADQPTVDLDLAPVAPELWQALGVAPQPCVRLRVVARSARPVAPAPPVRQPLVLRAAGATRLDGTVIGPGDAGLAGALVELPSLARSTTTDGAGRFSFARVPDAPATTVLVARAKGREVAVRVAVGPDPVVVHLDPLGG
ncbi:MAG TPA: Pvc16 family protein [Acidimicrobiales bacterium]